MIRPSSLTIAQWCDLAPQLQRLHPHRSPATDIGNDVDTQASDELRGDGVVATHEDAIALVHWVKEHLGGRPHRAVQEKVQLYDDDIGGLLTEGTPDYQCWDDAHLLTVDFKKREQYYAGRCSGPDDNLQPHAYSIARVQATPGLTTYGNCILLFGGGKVEALYSRIYSVSDWTPILENIKAIQQREYEWAQRKQLPPPTDGMQCLQCYPRLHCPSWVLPATNLDALKATLEPGGLTKENRSATLTAYYALGEVHDKLKGILRASVEKDGPIQVGDKAWRPIMMPGKSAIDSDAMAMELAALKDKPVAEIMIKYAIRGNPYPQFGWGKADKKK